MKDQTDFEKHVMEFSRDYEEKLNHEVLSDLPEEIRQQYRLISCLAINQHAETYLLESLENQQKVILKVINNTNDSKWREDHILCELDHPAIPSLIGTFTNNQKTFVLREYFEGKNLSQIIHLGRTFSIKESIHIALQICEILEYLHNQSVPIIYRDLKPDNIILSSNNELKLVDFDIARKFNPLTNTDTYYFGTRQYSAPEQFGYKQTDARTDVYALGILLFYLISGDTNLDQLHQLKQRKLKNIITKSTQFAPKDRYPSIHAFKSDLKSIRFSSFKIFPILSAVILSLVFSLGFLVGRHYQDQSVINSLSDKNAESFVTFKSPMIEQTVRDYLNIPNPTPIYTKDLERVESLHIWGDQHLQTGTTWILAYDPGFTKVKAFFDSYNGEYIDIQPGEMQSLDDLRLFPNLRKLDIVMQQVDDLTPLESLPLEELNIAGNSIEDLSPLSNIRTLTVLNISYNPVSDITPLRSLSNLTILNASDTSIESLRPLQNMSHLQYIYINNALISDLSPLSGLNLINCYFENNQIVDTSPAQCSGDTSFIGNPLYSP